MTWSSWPRSTGRPLNHVTGSESQQLLQDTVWRPLSCSTDTQSHTNSCYNAPDLVIVHCADIFENEGQAHSDGYTMSKLQLGLTHHRESPQRETPEGGLGLGGCGTVKRGGHFSFQENGTFSTLDSNMADLNSNTWHRLNINLATSNPISSLPIQLLLPAVVHHSLH